MNPATRRIEPAEKRQSSVPARASAPAQMPVSKIRQTDVGQVAGNMAMQRRMRTGAIQAKLNVSYPGDPYEREADRVAEAVINAQGPAAVQTASGLGRVEPGRLQHKCDCEEQPSQDGACGPCRAKQLNIQRRPAGGSKGEAVGKGETGVHEVLRTGGRPLDAAARAFFEPRFGRELGSVRVHSDASASASAKSINALAYTVGRDIIFAPGQYDAGSKAGRRLLAHELAHVIQQDFGSGLTGAVVQRQPDPAVPPEPAPTPEAPTDTSVPIPLPPEHDERVARLEEMVKDIELGTQAREELQAQVRNVVVGPATEEEQAERDATRAALKSREESLVAMYEDRITLIDESLAALQQLMPGVTPSPPDMPAASGVPAPDASVQSEFYRLTQEKAKDESRLKLLKRCVARKRIREIDATLAALPVGPSLEAIELEAEKKEQLEYLKSSTAGISCVKPSNQTHHPSKVSDAAFKKMKGGEGFVSIPYVALEGEAKGSGGCTIGYGHVINEKNDGRTCVHAQGPPPPKRRLDPGEKVELGPHLFQVGRMILRKCICTPDWRMSETEARVRADKDMSGAITYIKENVLVDLDEGQFDALVDIKLAVGSIPKSLLDVIHSKICVDDEAVRQEYMKTALYTKDNKAAGPVHAPRRKERVWAPKKDDDPTCV